jgi:2-dehydro-3-deoxyglucarate aldolase/4-hydroxy-2-oxoheptanedioate aldolase
VRENLVKQKLKSSGSAFGAMAFEFLTPGLPQILVNAGAEFVMYCAEHTGFEFETLKTQMALCRGLPIVPMMRVPAAEYHFIARALDIGAMGVMVPMVETAEQAAFIVSCTQYPPKGRRGAAFGFAHDDYQGGDIGEKIRTANERTLVIPMIETARGLEHVEAIAAVPGVDALWLGHFDLTNFLGIPGQFEHPRYVDAVDRIVAACRKHHLAPGFMAADETWARSYIGKGFRLIAAGLDQLMLQNAVKSNIAAMRQAAKLT